MKRIQRLLMLLFLSLATIVKAQTIDGDIDFYTGAQSTGHFQLEGSTYQAYFILNVQEDTPARILIKGDLPEYLYNYIDLRLCNQEYEWLDFKWSTQTIDKIGRVFETPNLKAGKYILCFDGYLLDDIQLASPELPSCFHFEYSVDCRKLQNDLGNLHSGIYPEIHKSSNMDILSFGKVEGQEVKISITLQPNSQMITDLIKYDHGKEAVFINEYKKIEYVDDTHQIIRINPELSGDVSLVMMADDGDSTTVLCPFVYTVECTFDPSYHKNFSNTDKASYIKTRIYQDSTGNAYLDEFEYFNGLGFPIQRIKKGITPSRENLIIMYEYDKQGRITKEWLPVCSASTCLFQKNAETIRSNAYQQYQDIFPFSCSYYEASPRVKRTQLSQPGYKWNAHIYNRTLDYNSDSNDIIQNACIKFNINSKSGKLEKNGYYPAGALLMETISDEDLKKNYEFKDLQNKTLLIRNKMEKENMDTYFVYDDLSNLRYVLPPMLAKTESFSDDSPEMKQYAYLYRYDYRNRCIAKRLPGCDWIYYTYDDADQLIFAQDGEQRLKGDWTFTIPDAFGRSALCGTCKNVININQKHLYAEYTSTGEYGGYTLRVDSAKCDLVLDSLYLINYYDSYRFLESREFSGLEYNDSLNNERYGDNLPENQYKHKGLLTGNMIALLDGLGKLYSATYYDNRKRIIQINSTNRLGGKESETYIYNYTDLITKKVHTLAVPDQSIIIEQYDYDYDHAGRVLNVSHQLNRRNSVLLAQYNYDTIGRLSGKSLNNGNLESQINYNIRNWTTGIQNDKFTQSLCYSDGVGIPCFNGNISSMKLQTVNDSIARGYLFSYDELNRMTNAIYGEGDSLKDNLDCFSEQVTGYDKQGNILGLKRYGKISDISYDLIDLLTMEYNGNQLVRVTDSITNSSYDNNFEFKDGINLPIEYSYDTNGNLKQDLNKKITDIQYNYLNLPSRIEFEDGSVISYLYDAKGTKHQTTHIIGNITNVTDCCGNVIYENGIAKTLLTDEGYVSLIDGKYHYYLKDYQENNCIVVDEDGEIEERNDYYPFGGLMASSTNSVQDYKYNGKELDRKGRLNWYDYGARQYDASLGRWHVVDPMAEVSYCVSPYNYCKNSPVNRVDIGGKWDVTVHVHKDRGEFGYGFLVVTDNQGNSVYTTTVRVEGSNSKENGYNKRDRTRTYADTPIGQYNIKGWSKRLPRTNRGAYGPNAVLELDYVSGEAAELRNGIHLHGGRQEGKGGKGKGSTLNVTQGCIRIYDEDIAKMKGITELLEENNSDEKGNTLNVVDDLKRIDDGPHPRPYAYPKERDEQNVNVWDMLYQMLQENTEIQFRIFN